MSAQILIVDRTGIKRRGGGTRTVRPKQCQTLQSRPHSGTSKQLLRSAMRVLVTGGAGYIGSVVADHLLRAGHTVAVLDNLIMGWREAVPGAAEFIQADTG